MYTLYLKESDQLDPSHFPVIALINEALNNNIEEFYQNLSNGTGCGYDYAECFFWQELDDYDKAHTNEFDGVCIETEENETIIIPYDQMLSYMNLAYMRYSEATMTSNANIEKALERFANKYVND